MQCWRIVFLKIDLNYCIKVHTTRQKKKDSKRCMFIVTSVPQKRFSAVQTLCPNLLCKKTTKGEGGVIKSEKWAEVVYG